MSKRYRIVKATDPKLIGVIFEYDIIKDVKPPIWFTDWSKAFEQRINDRLDKIESRLSSLETRVEKLENRLETVIKLNNLRTE